MSRRGHVYFIVAPKSGAIKIGFSNDPSGRFADLSTGSPEALVFYGSIPETRDYEQGLHRKFKHLRIKGEWFQACDELYNRIDGLADDYEEIQGALDLAALEAAE